ncbi:MAG TPA: hypothetical protein VK932_11495, partial [Kofleriaceae bacterium]|nr:hypothetical protein [Kofleriaceae bacterium]
RVDRGECRHQLLDRALSIARRRGGLDRELDAIGLDALAGRELAALTADADLDAAITAMDDGPLRRRRRDAHVGGRVRADARDALDERQPQRMGTPRGDEHQHQRSRFGHRSHRTAIWLPIAAALPTVAANRAGCSRTCGGTAAADVAGIPNRRNHMTTDNKLSPHTTWLFAFGSIATGIVASYALAGLGTKVTAAVYFAIVAIGGFASTYFTRARVRGAVLSFLTGAAVAAVAYFFLVNSIFESATTVMADAASGGQATSEGAKAGATLGKTFGIFVAVIVFLETIIAGIGGAVVGGKARGQGGLAALGALAKTAR